MNRRRIIRLSLLFLVIFLVVGSMIIRFFQDDYPLRAFFEGKDVFTQTWIGMSYGFIAGLLAVGLINLPFLKKSMDFFKKMLVPLKLSYPDILFLSFFTGFGEEYLFRAAIQPLIGIWVTSLIFVFLHGYLNPRNWQLSMYGIFMIFAVSGLGYLFQEIGYLSASLAHFTIDVVLLVYIVKIQKSGGTPA